MEANGKVPFLTTNRMRLRGWADGDVDSLFRILGQPGILQYFPQTEAPPRERVERIIAAQQKHWGEHGYGWWALERCSDSALMGWCGLQYLPDTDETEVGYLLGQEFWNHGFATEAARISLQFGFEWFPLDLIVGIVHPENGASRRVLEKLGMVLTREDDYFGMHCLRYAIDRASYEEIRTPGGELSEEVGG